MPEPAAGPRRLRALLVGIDSYRSPVPALRGCVHDIERVAGWLRLRALAAGDRFEPLLLRNEQATRGAVIDGFREHLGAATGRDTALFYFCGHGSQEPALPEHLAVEPDGLNETLVLVDSRHAGVPDLADKELALLVGEVAGTAGHVLVVLDCCHSGSGVREAADTDVRVRRAPAQRVRRPVETYLPGVRAVSGGRYVLLAACRPDQQAQERTIDGAARGVFSVAVERALAGIGGAPAYDDVQRWVAAAVRNMAGHQSPVLEAPDPADVRRPFLGGVAAPASPVRTASFERGHGWRLDAGRLHGVAPASPSDPMLLSLHRLGAGPGAPAVATAAVRAVQATTADLEPCDGGALDPAATYFAVVIRSGTPQATAVVAGHGRLADRVRQRLGSATTLRLTADQDADLVLCCTERAVEVRQPAAARPLAAALPDAPDAAERAVATAEHIGRWIDLSRRTNPSSTIAPDGVQLSVVDAAGEAVPLVDGAAEVRYSAGGRPVIGISYRNNLGVPLHCAVLGLSERYGVECLTIGGSVRLRPREVAWVTNLDGRPRIQTFVPDGQDRTTDLLLLLASTDQFDAQTLRQPDLAGQTRTERGFTRVPVGAPPGANWTTRSVAVTTIRPGAGLTSPGG